MRAGGKCGSGDGTTGKGGVAGVRGCCGWVWRGRGDKHTVGAILPDPAGEALAGAVDGVAGAVVGAAADLGAGSAEPAARTDCGKKSEPTTSKQLKPTQRGEGGGSVEGVDLAAPESEHKGEAV